MLNSHRFLFRYSMCLVFASLGIVYFPFSNWLALTSHGSYALLVAQMLFAAPLLICFLGFPVFVMGVFFQSTRRVSVVSIVFCFVCVPCLYWSVDLGRELRTGGIRESATRAEPLVNAIKAYELAEGSPPKQLEDLVPRYLDSIPATGMGAYPNFRYLAGPLCAAEFGGNPWALWIETPLGIMNWDRVVYLPHGNEQTPSLGRNLEVIGDWVYIHE